MAPRGLILAPHGAAGYRKTLDALPALFPTIAGNLLVNIVVFCSFAVLAVFPAQPYAKNIDWAVLIRSTSHSCAIVPEEHYIAL